MTEYEATDVALQLIGFVHDLGNAMEERIEFWGGISYGLIAIAYVAPQHLNRLLASFIIALYFAFSVFTFQDVWFDMRTADAGRRDALQVLERHGLDLQSVKTKARLASEKNFSLLRGVSAVYVPGLFFGTIGFVLFTARRQRKHEHRAVE